VERDYALAHAIAAIATADKSHHLIFKGGTSLRFVHLEDCRYSADLDFSVVGATTEAALSTIRAALAVNSSEGPLLRLTDGEPPAIAYTGPLGRERAIKLDLADDELVVHAERYPLRPRWADVGPVEVTAYTTLEVAAEKLRCVLQRLQCRDFIDLDVMFEVAAVDARAAAELFRKKAIHRGFDPATFPNKYRSRVLEYRKRWEEELSEHVPGTLPTFGALERRVSRRLRSAGLLS
jgi:predicted nucleotidyltransferase component of viral defense system